MIDKMDQGAKENRECFATTGRGIHQTTFTVGYAARFAAGIKRA